jgi:hypothetical protein
LKIEQRGRLLLDFFAVGSASPSTKRSAPLGIEWAQNAEMISAFARSDILDRERPQQIGSGLGIRYMLQRGLAEFSQSLKDGFEIVGFKLLKTRVTTLRLWLRLWDTQAGQMLWESAGGSTVATELLREQAAVPLTEIARVLWLRMIQDDFLGGR